MVLGSLTGLSGSSWNSKKWSASTNLSNRRPEGRTDFDPLRPKRAGPREWTPTGVLVFRAEEVYGTNASHQWRETAARHMEDRLEEVAEGVAALLVRKHEREVALVESRKRDEERRRIEAEKERRSEHERARLRKLERLALSLDQAERVRRLARAIEESSRNSTVDSREFVSWALRHADRMDPVSRILAEIGSGKDAAEPEYEDRYPHSEARRRW